MQVYQFQHGPVTAVIYPKKGRGVMLVPDASVYRKDASDEYEASLASLASLARWGMAPELDPEVVPATVGGVECVRVGAMAWG